MSCPTFASTAIDLAVLMSNTPDKEKLEPAVCGVTQTSPTGITFSSAPVGGALVSLLSLLKTITLMSGKHNVDDRFGISKYDKWLNKRMPGGIGAVHIGNLWSLWNQESHVTELLQRDTLCNSCVISSDLYAETKRFWLS